MTSTYHIGLLLLRVGFSGMMLTHGIPKLMKLVQGNMEFGDPIGIGSSLSLILVVIGEAICPLLIIIGYKTRLATIPIIITIAQNCLCRLPCSRQPGTERSVNMNAGK